ncbi:MAG TPA: hypothetical protein VKX25_18835 [Bryobacteraceae bacterium]|jgi:hypothetical protein|nr:hypothetical protein [Bryobacteraceae bacterium]
MTDRSRRIWRRVAIGALIATTGFFIAGEIVLHNAGPILKGRIIETLSTRFDSHVELDNLDVSIGRGLEVGGQGLRIFPPDAVVAAGAKQPLLAVRNFHFHSGVSGLFLKPMHVAAVSVTGLDINIPPREMRQQGDQHARKHKGKIKIVVDEILCDDSRLVIGTIKPDKDPKTFALRHIEMHEVGPNAPWRYDAVLTNAVPRGEIQSRGAFGPWQTESPGDSYVDGHYIFSHADLNTIKGIGGILSSVGDFKGRLNRIEVHGTTHTPDFSLDTANRGILLDTKFKAIVDGTSGDTYLQPVAAKLGESSFSVRGAVISVKGKGHRVQLDADIPGARIQDFLDLAVKTQPPVLTGTLQTKTRITIEPGQESVTQKLKSRGSFMLGQIHFTNTAVQDKVDMLSLRARGEPKKAKPGAADVDSRMQGDFSIGDGRIVFSRLIYSLPGADVSLAGVYSMDGQQFDFKGKVMTKATLRHMVASWWKSWLLTPVSPFFKKDGVGAEIPVTISGTRSEPKFGLNLFGHSDKDKPRNSGKE